MLTGKRRKIELVAELELISEKLIDIQVCVAWDSWYSITTSKSDKLQMKLEAEKRKPVPTVPILNPEEHDKDPFQVVEQTKGDPQ